MTTRYKAYIASPLTGLDETEREEVYRKLNDLKEICKDYDIEAYIPGKFTDPVKNPEVEPYAVYQTDRDRVRTSDLFVLLAVKPSFGAGQEVEIAYNSLIPMMILQPKGSDLSRMVAGVPSRLKYVASFDDESLEKCFREGVLLLKPHIERRRSGSSFSQSNTIGKTINLLREENNLSLDELSTALGISSEELDFIERSDDYSVNPSMIIISRLATALGVDPERILFSDFHDRKLNEFASKLVKVLKKLPYTEIVGARTKDHAINDEDLMTMVMRLILEEN